MVTKTTVELELKSNLLEQSKHAKNIKDSLEAAARIRVLESALSYRAGVPSGRVSAATYKDQKEESRGYGVARSVGPGTGAEGRDFAKQAQGLGGLVHVYATFAANLFAVSAAFTALSRAADTTNMVKGLDQLGVSSGRALGSLAKRLSQVTDGAISLKDAMTATAQSSAGGMTDAAILRMGNVAKQASQALGIAMPDAISRLSRGITKLEPELLDEIGIMVRVDTASQNYARTLGKTVSALTDFEKRQGFANAVLEQGEKKFGAIKIDANPYAKILASMENIAFVGLELVNKVLNPLLSILSSSPTALAAAMAGIAGLLLKQAIPAIGMLKETSAAAAVEAGKLAQAKVDIVKKGYEESALGVKAAANAEAKTALAIAVKNADDIANAKAEILGKYEEKRISKYADQKGAAGVILRKDLADITPKNLKSLETTAQGMDTKAMNAQVAGNEKLAKSYIASADAHRGYITVIEDAQKGHATYVQSEKAAIAISEAAQRQATVAAQAYVEEQVKKQGALSTATQNQVIANRALIASKASDIVATAGQTASTKGFVAAMQEANNSVKTARGNMGPIQGPQMGPIIGSWTLLKSGIAGATSAISTFLNFAGPWIAIIGLAVAAISVLSSWLSTAEKEIDKFNTSLEGTTSSTKLLKDVSSDLFSRDSKEWLTAESMQARSSAIMGANDSIKDMLKTLREARLASNWWDNLFDGLFSKSRLQKTAVAITDSIKESIKLARPSEAKTIFEQKILEVTGSKSVDSIKPSKLTEDQLKTLSATYAQFSSEVAKNSEQLSAPKKAFDALGTAMQNISTAMMPTDNLSKFGISLMDVGSSLQAAAKDTHGYFEELVRVSKDTAKLSLLPDGRGKELASQSKALEDLGERYNSVTKGIENITVARSKLNNLDVKFSETAGGAATGNVSITKQALKPDTLARDSYDQQLAILKTAQAGYSEEISKKSSEFADLAGASLRAGAKHFTSALDITMAQGALKLSGAVANSITGLGSAEAKAQVALKDIALRVRSNDIMVKLIEENQKNTLAIISNTTMTDLDITQRKIDILKTSNTPSDQAELLNLQSKARSLIATQASVKVAITWMNSPKGLLGKVAGATTADDVGAAGMLKGTAQQLAKAEADKSVLGSEAAMVKYNASLGKIAEKYVSINRIQQNNITLLETEQKNTAQLAGITNSMSVQNYANSEAINIEKEKSILLDNALKQLEEEHIVKKSKAGSLSSLELQSYNDQKAALIEKTKEQTASNNASKIARDIADNTKLAAIETYKLEGVKLAQDLKMSLDTSKVDNSKAQLESLKAISAINDIIYAQEKGKLDIQSLVLANTKETNAIEDTRRIGLAAAALADKDRQTILNGMKAPKNEAESIALSDKKSSAANDLLEAQNKVNSAADTGLAIARAKLATDTLTTNQQSSYNELLATQADQMDKMVSATESLSSVFGELGTNIGSAGKALLQMSQDDEKYSLRKLAIQAAIDKATNPEEKAKQTKNLGDLDKKQAIQEVSNIGKVAGASKKMFSEKTAAYKILDGIEKVSAAYKFAMQVKDIAMDIKNFAIKIGLLQAEVPIVAATTAAKTGIELSGQAATMPAKIAGIYASFMSMLGPFGAPAAALAIAALIGSFAGGSSSGDSIPRGSNSEDAQKTQGTGQSYKRESVNGKLVDKLVDNGGGVYGDTEAKSKAIVDSLEILKNNSIEGLSYDNKLLAAMEKVASALGAAAKSLYQIPGLRVGSAFNTTEGSSGKKTLGWGTTTDKSIIDSGIKLQGTFTELARTGSGAASIFEKVQTTTNSSSWFGLKNSSKTSVSVNNRSLDSSDPEAAAAIADVFKNATAMFIEIGDYAGIAKSTIEDKLGALSIDLETSTRGLTGKALEEELNAVIGNALSSGAKSIFSEFEKYRKFGEDYLTTTIRVVDSSNKLSLALGSIGIATYATVNSLAKYDLSETLIKNAGGLEQFLANIKLFGDNFLTEAQRLEPITKAVSASMIKAGEGSEYSAELFKTVSEGNTGLVNTREEFSKLYSENLKVAAGTGETALAAQTLATALDKVAPSFLMTVKAAEEAAEKTKNLQKGLLTSQGKDQEVLGLNRSASLEDKDLTASDALILKATYAQEDLNKTKDLELSLMTAQGKAAEVLVLTRAKELQGLSVTNAELVAARHVQEDYNKTKELETRLLSIQGKGLELLNLTRAKELKGLSERDTALMLVIHTEEDLVRTKDLELTLMTAQGRATEVLALTRAKELKGLSVTNAELVTARHVQEDYNKTKDFELRLMTLQGRSLEVLTLTRAKELKGLSERDAAVVKQTHNQEDLNVQTTWQNRLGILLGSTTARKIALETDLAAATNYTTKSLIRQVYAQEELAEVINGQMQQNIAVYELLGNTEKALQLTREKELSTLNPKLVAGQKYLYALQDEASIKTKLKAAYEKQNTTLTGTVTNLNNFIKSIMAARDALVLGDQSILTPAQKYKEAKAQSDALVRVLANTGSDPASVAARDDALSKLPTTTSAFLEASRVLYASSEQYTKDFTEVLGILTDTGASLALQQTDAEKQLAQLVTSVGYLDSISTGTDNIVELLTQLASAKVVSETNKALASASGLTSAGGTALSTVATVGKAKTIAEWSGNIGELGPLIREALASSDDATVLNSLIRQGINSTMAYTALGGQYPLEEIKQWAANLGVPGFANGGVANGLAMVGEKGPELVNFATPSRVYSNKASNDMFNNKELVAEIRRLNAMVDRLVQEQNQQTGHIIASNYAANAEAAQKIANATIEAVDNANWKQRSAIKIA